MEYPEIRNIEAFPVQDQGRDLIGIRDPSNLTDKILFISQPAFFILSLFDGKHSIVDIQAKFMRRYGEMLFTEQITEIVSSMDENLFLESGNFHAHKERVENEFLGSPVRRPLMELKGIKQTPEEARKEIEGCFTAEGGPGLPNGDGRAKDVVGAILPHIDYRRGGVCYAWGYKEIVERTDAALFIIFGTHHSCAEGIFTLTKKDFATPFGVVQTDKRFIEGLERRVSWDLFAGEFGHRNEHSIELQATFLHGVLGEKRRFTIVPVLCGPAPAEDGNNAGGQNQMFWEFINAVRETVRERGEKVFFIASADLSHMGPQFGDRELMTIDRLKLLEERDRATLSYVERADGDGFYRDVTKDGNQRKICGLYNIHALLKVMDTRGGTLIRYDMWPDEKGTVTFASVVFT
ncbi:MAG: AmmeMemoRadiSam system protein B [Nitrospinae bacterium]|nr:AmmeMemoRadiSam system protein B [Nitrospinota bacterium]